MPRNITTLSETTDLKASSVTYNYQYFRLRKRRAAGKYRVLSHSDDQEMFPLAAGEGDDEEIFNAAHHQSRK